jgi:hypothetical protein
MRNLACIPLLAILLVPACAHNPVYQSSGPSTRDGVKVAIVGQSCDQYRDPNIEFDDFVGLELDLEVRNGTDAPLTVHRDMIRVIAEDGVAPKTMTWKADEPIQVEAGRSRRVSVRYMNRGDLECRGPLDLDLKNAVSRGGAPLALAPIHFVASR